MNIQKVKNPERKKFSRQTKYAELFETVSKMRAGSSITIDAPNKSVLADNELHRLFRLRIGNAVKRRFPDWQFSIFRTDEGIAITRIL